MISNAAKSFDILATSLNVLHNYFEYFNKIIFKSVSKFLDTLTKPFFLCIRVHVFLQLSYNCKSFTNDFSTIYARRL